MHERNGPRRVILGACKADRQRQSRGDEYRRHVERLKAERADYLAEFPGLDEAIVKAVS